MLHMTLGCSWHHGLSAPHLCLQETSLSSCCTGSVANLSVTPHEDDLTGHCHENCNHDSESPWTTEFEPNKSDHNHGHFCCQDDGCYLTKVAKFVFKSVDFSVAYLGGAEDSATSQITRGPWLAFDPFPDCRGSAPIALPPSSGNPASLESACQFVPECQHKAAAVHFGHVWFTH